MVGSSVITIGNFDGVHLGHRAILQRARKVAQDAGLPVTVLTFDPHPITVLCPERTPGVLTPKEDKIAALKAAGADQVIVLEPTRDLLSLSPDQFIEHTVDRCAPVAVVEGRDFRFGKDRLGNVETIRRLGQRLGFALHLIDPVEVALSDQLMAVVSSSLIRWLLGLGRVDDAACCLGRPYQLAGRVVAGRQRGRSMRVPTVNLDPAAIAQQVVPANGVYGGRAILSGGSSHQAAISVGCQPTFAARERVIEAHLLSFDGDLYGETVTLRFDRWLRDQRPFPDRVALQHQLQCDLDQIRQWGVVDAAERAKPLPSVR